MSKYEISSGFHAYVGLMAMGIQDMEKAFHKDPKWIKHQASIQDRSNEKISKRKLKKRNSTGKTRRERRRKK